MNPLLSWNIRSERARFKERLPVAIIVSFSIWNHRGRLFVKTFELSVLPFIALEITHTPFSTGSAQGLLDTKRISFTRKSTLLFRRSPQRTLFSSIKVWKNPISHFFPRENFKYLERGRYARYPVTLAGSQFVCLIHLKVLWITFVGSDSYDTLARKWKPPFSLSLSLSAVEDSLAI